MNTNPKAIRVLCYGDSNTHGRDAKQKAKDGVKTRLPVGVRWTSLVQEMLGTDFEVIEEGLGGRTTDLDDPKDPSRNGLTYLHPCIASHVPIDIVVFMLGTNDLKDKFERSADDVAQANKRLLGVITDMLPNTKIILISPIHVDGNNPMSIENYSLATKKSHQLGEKLSKVADEFGYAFIDIAQHIQPSKYDGVHIDEKDQRTVAELVVRKIKEICH